LQSLIDKKILNTNEEINVSLLLKKRIIKKKLNGIKILGNGEIKNKIKIQVTKISKSALKKIEKRTTDIKNQCFLTKKFGSKLYF